MEDPVVILRMVERITAIIIAGIAIYLGYRLFFHLPFERDHGGQLELPGVKIVLTRAGPGIFFSAFGSLVLYYSLTNPVTITEMIKNQEEEKKPEIAENIASGTVAIKKFIGFSGTITPQQHSKTLTTIEMLNCAQRVLTSESLRPNFNDQMSLAIFDAKRTLMLSIWNENDWGPADQFTLTGPTDDSPFQLRSIFNSTYEECPK